jgi:hypothetical protein
MTVARFLRARLRRGHCMTVTLLRRSSFPASRPAIEANAKRMRQALLFAHVAGRDDSRRHRGEQRFLAPVRRCIP